MLSEVFYDAQQAGPESIKRGSCRFSAFTARAPGKESANEDCAGWMRLPGERWVFMVADGLGGLPAGASASSLAIKTILERLGALGSDDDCRAAILEAIDLANAAVLATGSGGATTLALVEWESGAIRPYHIGDSMILVSGQRGQLKFQSVSHSPTGYLEEAGIIEEIDAMQHEERHIVSNVLGSAEMRLEIGPRIALNKYDTVLLASDGLRDNLNQETVIELLRKGNLENCVAQLAKLCHKTMTSDDPQLHAHPDDLTLLAMRRAN